MISQLNDIETKKLGEQFTIMDTNKDGTIS